MKPWLWLPTKLAHDLSPLALSVLASVREPTVYHWGEPLNFKKLTFTNRLGLAGGVDKDASMIESWWTFGPGFIEIGTVTPLPQGPNPGKIMDRDKPNLALWNRMGFPGRGVEAVRANLLDLPPRPRLTPIFVNIGKNRATPLENAGGDYAQCIARLAGLADAFVINISSPNTAGLRDLFQVSYLRDFLRQVVEARDRSAVPYTPLLLKLSPDLEERDLGTVVETALEFGIDGFIATNTTAARDLGSPFPVEGGVSGRPLAARSKAGFQALLRTLGAERREGRLLISVGGVMTPEDVQERLQLGADLVQVYSALVFFGPWFFRQVARHMIARS